MEKRDALSMFLIVNLFQDKAQKKELVANQIKETKLETRTAQFISVICDITMMKQQMMEIGKLVIVIFL
jgi:inosine/xanthosine triphosphate pyrophosphatase family protein